MNQTNRPGGYVVAVGPNDIDEYYECVQPLVVGDKCFIRQLSVSPGGLTANSAVILSAFGTKTYLLDSLGDDQYTPMLLEDLRSHGIDTDYIEVLPGEENIRAQILLSGNEKTVLLYENHKPFITMTPQKRELMEGASYIYTTMVNMKEIEGNRELIDGLVAHGVKIMYDAERSTFTSYDDPDDRFYFERASVLSFNDASLEKFCAGGAGGHRRAHRRERQDRPSDPGGQGLHRQDPGGGDRHPRLRRQAQGHHRRRGHLQRRVPARPLQRDDPAGGRGVRHRRRQPLHPLGGLPHRGPCRWPRWRPLPANTPACGSRPLFSDSNYTFCINANTYLVLLTAGAA